MISFDNDYSNGAHPKVLQKLVETNELRTQPYGADECCMRAKELIKAVCEDEEANVFFLTGGTQTNATVIDSMLYQYEGVIAVDTGHINVHEAGAIEFTEHKIIVIPSHEGKMHARDLRKYLDDFMHDGSNAHCVYPGCVYITFPTELGTLYKASEIAGIYEVCKEYGIMLYVDGARMGYGLMSEGNDVTLPFLARHCDVFYIGGTKCGLLFGEAVVILNDALKPDFRTIAKQCGSIMAKGRLLGVQFGAIMKDHLYSKICGKGTLQALKIRDALLAKGFKFVTESPTNQQFVIMTPAQFEKLSEEFALSHIAYLEDGNYSVRICTSWATKDEEVDRLIAMINEL